MYLTLFSPDDCYVCLYNQCCGQWMDCSKDTVCPYKYAGPLYEAYIDCMMNCCGDTCGR
jgi:hypothetical protein